MHRHAQYPVRPRHPDGRRPPFTPRNAVVIQLAGPATVRPDVDGDLALLRRAGDGEGVPVESSEKSRPRHEHVLPRLVIKVSWLLEAHAHDLARQHLDLRDFGLEAGPELEDHVEYPEEEGHGHGREECAGGVVEHGRECEHREQDPMGALEDPEAPAAEEGDALECEHNEHARGHEPPDVLHLTRLLLYVGPPSHLDELGDGCGPRLHGLVDGDGVHHRDVVVIIHLDLRPRESGVGSISVEQDHLPHRVYEGHKEDPPAHPAVVLDGPFPRAVEEVEQHAPLADGEEHEGCEEVDELADALSVGEEGSVDPKEDDHEDHLA
mmetsp:Transcript_61495/g.194647  ORF Transcript_61495/g.194647 Transcript_61495/m.194647 type:complete len:323 (-) Transcript_61495:465-1433(-)